MPKAPRKARTTRRRKAPRKRAPRRRKTFRFVQALQPIYRTTLKYIDYKHITLDNSNPEGSFVFRLNDLFDPDYTATGHQAKYRDQFYQLYNYGRVMAVSIKIIYTHDDKNPVRLIAGPNGDNYISSFGAFSEDRKVQKRLITQDRSCKTYYKTYVDKHLGNKKGTWKTDNSFEQTSTGSLANPASCWYSVNLSRFFNLQAVSTVCMQIEIKQMVEFSGQVPFGQS